MDFRVFPLINVGIKPGYQVTYNQEPIKLGEAVWITTSQTNSTTPHQTERIPGTVADIQTPHIHTSRLLAAMHETETVKFTRATT